MNYLMLDALQVLEQQAGLLSDKGVLVANIILAGVSVIASIWFIASLLRDLKDLRNKDVTIQEAAKKSLKSSILIFLGFVLVVSILFPLVNTVFSETFNEGFQVALVGML